MGAAVGIWDYTSFSSRYPEFNTTVNATQAQDLWTQATLFHRNDGCGRGPKDPLKQEQMLEMVTAHLAQLFFGSTLAPATALVGHINSAGQGSVNVATEMQIQPGTAAWWNQTKYGAMYWAATAIYRTMGYFPGHSHIVNPWPYG
jgi:hypothetical protein